MEKTNLNKNVRFAFPNHQIQSGSRESFLKRKANKNPVSLIFINEMVGWMGHLETSPRSHNTKLTNELPSPRDFRKSLAFGTSIPGPINHQGRNPLTALLIHPKKYGFHASQRSYRILSCSPCEAPSRSCNTAMEAEKVRGKLNGEVSVLQLDNLKRETFSGDRLFDWGNSYNYDHMS